MIYCNCGHFLVESESTRKFNKLRLDALSIAHYDIKKERPRGARHGKIEAQKEQAFLDPQRSEEMYQEKFEGIHDRFLRGPTYRDSHLKIGWTEEKCIEMDRLAQENHSYCPFSEEFV